MLRFVFVPTIQTMTNRTRPNSGNWSYDETPVLPCADKLAFDEQRQAATAATVAAYQHGADVRPYLCRYCGLWHLASNFD